MRDWTLEPHEELQVALSLALHKHVPGWGGCTDEQMEAVAKEVLAAEREAIAQLVEKFGNDPQVAAAIRARGEKT